MSSSSQSEVGSPAGVAGVAVTVITIGTVFEVIALATLTLRFLSKISTKSLGADDWVAVVAMVFVTCRWIADIVAGTIGCGGVDTKFLQYDQVETYLLWVYIDNIFYALSLPTIKISLLLMYCRIFKSVRIFKSLALALGVIVIGWMISTVLAQIFTCWPVEGAWNPLAAEHCIDQVSFYYGNAISNLLTDVLILTLPIPWVWQLQLSQRKRIGLICVFLLGGLVCIASILRITSFSQIDNANITGTLPYVAIWTCIETPLALISACLPTLPGYFKTKVQALTGRGGPGNTQSRSLIRLSDNKDSSQCAESHNESFDGETNELVSHTSFNKQ